MGDWGIVTHILWNFNRDTWEIYTKFKEVYAWMCNKKHNILTIQKLSEADLDLIPVSIPLVLYELKFILHCRGSSARKHDGSWLLEFLSKPSN